MNGSDIKAPAKATQSAFKLKKKNHKNFANLV